MQLASRTTTQTMWGRVRPHIGASPVRMALALGMAITLAALIVVLAQSPLTVIARNDAAGAERELGLTGRNGARVCQGGETIPRGAVAVRVSLYALTGPPIEATVLQGTRIRDAGERSSGWTGASVTIPIREIKRTLSPATLCVAPLTAAEPMPILGAPTRPRLAAYRKPGHVFDGRVKVVYLGRGHASWMSLALSVARRMGLGRAWSGSWIAALVAALMLALAGLTSALVLRQLDV